MKIPCKCGCGELTEQYSGDGRLKQGYVHHHWGRGVIRPTHRKKVLKERTLYHRAKENTDITPCIINNVQCHGPVQTHHKDKNLENFEKDNLIRLCNVHHRLHHKRHLDYPELQQIFWCWNCKKGERDHRFIPPSYFGDRARAFYKRHEKDLFEW